jgi:hypothetical protein
MGCNTLSSNLPHFAVQLAPGAVLLLNPYIPSSTLSDGECGQKVTFRFFQVSLRRRLLLVPELWSHFPEVLRVAPGRHEFHAWCTIPIK